MTIISVFQIFSANTCTGTSNGSPLNTPIATPHNIVLNEAGNKIFVTRSGSAANTVSTYSVNATTLSPSTTITVGNNPLGITYYKREIQ